MNANIDPSLILLIVFIFMVAIHLIQLNVAAAATADTNFIDENQLKNVQQTINENLNDANISVPDLIRKYGYTVEIHTVQTSDGYLLEMHRICKNGTLQFGRPPVFLMHGLLESSAVFVFMGPQLSLGFLLANLGYDVWMGNARGNRYSRKHLTLNPDGNRTERQRFWSFSWHEIGIYDLPAMIDYILAETVVPKLHYIGHSQGTTTFFVMCSERPEYNEKIGLMQAFAPIAYIKHMRSPLLKAAASMIDTIDIALNILGMYEFLPDGNFVQGSGQSVCTEDAPIQSVCSNVIFLLCGYDSEQMNKTLIPVFMGHLPAGASTHQIIHYGQLYRSGTFRQFDWGLIGNLKKYRSRRPPTYRLDHIRVPIAMHYSTNDWLSDPIDVHRLDRELPGSVEMYLVPYARFNHLDFVMAKNVDRLLYQRVIGIMERAERDGYFKKKIN